MGVTAGATSDQAVTTAVILAVMKSSTGAVIK
jgi:hypothetical protein